MASESRISQIRSRVLSAHAYSRPSVEDMENAAFLLNQQESLLSLLRGLRADPGVAHWWEEVDAAIQLLES